MSRIHLLALSLLGGLACAVPATAGSAQASLDIDMTVVPSACSITLSAGGVIDYGAISTTRLNRDAATSLEAKSLQLGIHCDARTYVALRAVDNRDGSATPASDGFGLGKVGGQPIGAYALYFGPVQVDGASALPLRSTDDGDSWSTDARKLMPHAWYGFDTAQAGAPAAFTSLSAELLIQARIAPLDTLPVNQSVLLDGSATLEIIYL